MKSILRSVKSDTREWSFGNVNHLPESIKCIGYSSVYVVKVHQESREKKGHEWFSTYTTVFVGVQYEYCTSTEVSVGSKGTQY